MSRESPRRKTEYDPLTGRPKKRAQTSETNDAQEEERSAVKENKAKDRIRHIPRTPKRSRPTATTTTNDLKPSSIVYQDSEEENKRPSSTGRLLRKKEQDSTIPKARPSSVGPSRKKRSSGETTEGSKRDFTSLLNMIEGVDNLPSPPKFTSTNQRESSILFPPLPPSNDEHEQIIAPANSHRRSSSFSVLSKKEEQEHEKKTQSVRSFFNGIRASLNSSRDSFESDQDSQLDIDYEKKGLERQIINLKEIGDKLLREKVALDRSRIESEQQIKRLQAKVESLQYEVAQNSSPEVLTISKFELDNARRSSVGSLEYTPSPSRTVNNNITRAAFNRSLRSIILMVKDHYGIIKEEELQDVLSRFNDLVPSGINLTMDLLQESDEEVESVSDKDEDSAELSQRQIDVIVEGIKDEQGSMNDHNSFLDPTRDQIERKVLQWSPIHASLLEELENLRATIEDLEFKKDVLANDVESSRAEHFESLDKLYRLSDENDQLKQQVKDEQRKVQESESKVEEATVKYKDALSRKNDEHQEFYSSVLSEEVAHHNQTIALNEENDSLKKKLSVEQLQHQKYVKDHDLEIQEKDEEIDLIVKQQAEFREKLEKENQEIFDENQRLKDYYAQEYHRFNDEMWAGEIREKELLGKVASSKNSEELSQRLAQKLLEKQRDKAERQERELQESERKQQDLNQRLRDEAQAKNHAETELKQERDKLARKQRELDLSESLSANVRKELGKETQAKIAAENESNVKEAQRLILEQELNKSRVQVSHLDATNKTLVDESTGLKNSLRQSKEETAKAQQEMASVKKEKVIIREPIYIEKEPQVKVIDKIVKSFEPNYKSAALNLFGDIADPANETSRKIKIDYYRNHRARIHKGDEYKEHTQVDLSDKDKVSDEEVIAEIKKDNERAVQNNMEKLVDLIVEKGMNKKVMEEIPAALMITVLSFGADEDLKNYKELHPNANLRKSFCGKLDKDSKENEIRNKAVQNVVDIMDKYGVLFGVIEDEEPEKKKSSTQQQDKPNVVINSRPSYQNVVADHIRRARSQ